MAAKKPDVRDSARELARLGARLGGEARAAVLTAEERREIARKAVLARWKKHKGEAYQPPPDPSPAPAVPALAARLRPARSQALRSVFRGRLKIGGFSLNCHLLSDGTRVFEHPQHESDAGDGRSGTLLAKFVSRAPRTDVPAWGTPVSFKVQGSLAPRQGREAGQLVAMSEAYLRAREKGELAAADQPLARQAELLARACAMAGIVALFDGATGYREFRARRTLRRKLLALIAHDLHHWARAFPEDFWEELSRLEGIRHRKNHHPLRWGRYVIFFLHDAVGAELDSQPPASDPELLRRVDRQQWLDDFVKNGLSSYVRGVVSAMRGCRTMEDFSARFAGVFSNIAAQAAFDELPRAGR
jgi:hypothetical protein